MDFSNIIRVTFFFGIVPSPWNRAVCDKNEILHPVSYSWIIDNFNSYEIRGKILESDEFPPPPNPIRWFLTLEPDGKDQKLDIYLRATEYRSKNEENVAMSILNSRQQKWEAIKMRKTGSHSGHLDNNEINGFWEWAGFIKKDDYFIKQLLSNDTLWILCEIHYGHSPSVNPTRASVHRLSQAKAFSVKSFHNKTHGLLWKRSETKT